MPDDFDVRGAEQLVTLGRRIKAAGDAELRKELLRGLRASGKRLQPDVRRAALAGLPRRGGLNVAVASRLNVSTRNRLSGDSAGVSLVGTRRGLSLREMDEGSLRHPVFGHRAVWVGQRITPGFWSREVERHVPQVRQDIRRVMEDVGRRLGG